MPKDHALQEDNRLKLVNKGGQTFFVPAADRSVGIISFGRWEQAFRVFSNVYLGNFPEKAMQLIQYNHIISTAALTYVWDNVYVTFIERFVHYFASGLMNPCPYFQ